MTIIQATALIIVGVGLMLYGLMLISPDREPDGSTQKSFLNRRRKSQH